MKNILNLLTSRVGPVFISSHEEDRFLESLAKSAGQRRVLRWSVTRGWLVRLSLKEETELKTAGKAVTSLTKWKAIEPEGEESVSPVAAMQWLFHTDNYKKFCMKDGNNSQGPFFVLCDTHTFFEDTVTFTRWVREIVPTINEMNAGLAFLAPEFNLPVDLEKIAIQTRLALPDQQGVEERVTGRLEVIAKSPYFTHYKTYLSDPVKKKALVSACMGLTELEIGNALNISCASLKPDLVEEVQKIKCKIISDSGLMDYYPASTLTEVGGLDHLKEWISHRTMAFSEEAKAFGLDAPKGLLLLGTQGCGKSLASKAIAGAFGMSLIKMDIGRLMGSLVGQSEANIRKALELAERVSPAVLWIDEVEKGLAGSASSGSTDGGTTSRVLQTILTWMNDKTAPVFVVCTANGIANLPPELLRKGRMDEIFFVDLPTKKERKEILGIHLAKKKRDPANFNLDAVVAVTSEFSGAELEQLVKAAMYLAFANKRELNTEDLVTAAKKTIPLAHTMKEQIQAIRSFCSTRAVRASDPEEVEQASDEAPFTPNTEDFPMNPFASSEFEPS